VGLLTLSSPLLGMALDSTALRGCQSSPFQPIADRHANAVPARATGLEYDDDSVVAVAVAEADVAE